MCFAPQRRTIFEHPTFKKWSEHVVFCTFWLANVLRATAAYHFWTSDVQKVVRTCGVFAHFDLQMCFAPQRRAILPDRNFQNWSAIVVFCAFWLANVLRATAECNFSTSELQKVLRHRQFFSIFTSKCASRRSGVPFFRIATSKMAPTVRCFVHFWLTNVLRATAPCHFSPVCWTATSAPAAVARLLFEHQKARIIEKHSGSRRPLTFRARVPAF